MSDQSRLKPVSSFLSLFFSLGTLFCCALPALLVVLGLGASLAGLVSAFPQIVWLSEYKALVFTISGLMIFLSFVFHFKSRSLECPVDELAEDCAQTKSWSKWILYFSAAIYLIGFFFAFFAVEVI